jgi:hypothetical protein
MMRKIWSGLILLFIWGLTSPALAGSSLIFQAVGTHSTKIEVQGSGEGFSIPGATRQQLTLAIQGLNNAARHGARPADVTVRPGRRIAQVCIAGQTIITVDRKLARAQGSTPRAAANQLRNKIAPLFALTYVAFEPDSVVVPLRENRTIKLSGNLPADLVAGSTAPEVVEVSLQDRELTLLGLETGAAIVQLVGENVELDLQVEVKRWACQMGIPMTVSVTGRTVPKAVLLQAAEAAVRQAVHSENGAQVKLAFTAAGPLLSNMAQATVQVSMTAQGPGLITVARECAVSLSRAQVPPRAASVLMVSNSPERITERGICSQGTVEPNAPVRLLYHHVNQTAKPAVLAVELSNPGDLPTVIQVIGAAAGPSRDEIYVGHSATMEFMKYWSQDTGYLVTIPPGMRFRPFQQLLPVGTIASGLATFRVVSGPPALLQVRLNAADDADMLLPSDGQYKNEIAANWRFTEIEKIVTARYDCGKYWTFIPIGDDPVQSTAGDVLLGNYGLTYQVALELVNPQEQAATVDILLSAPSGPARGSIFIDGQLYETGLVHTHGEERLARYALAPGQTRRVSIQIIPQSGSYYPIRLIARER